MSEFWHQFVTSSTPLEFLLEAWGDGRLFKEAPCVTDLKGVLQNPEWHPEGTALCHTFHVVHAMAQICDERPKVRRDVLLMAALLHDIGKVKTTRVKDGRIVSPGHDVAGAEMVDAFLHHPGRFTYSFFSYDERKAIVALVRWHMTHCRPIDQVTKKSANKLAVNLKNGQTNWEELKLLMEADCAGRPPLPPGLPPCVDKMDSYMKELTNGSATTS